MSIMRVKMMNKGISMKVNKKGEVEREKKNNR